MNYTNEKLWELIRVGDDVAFHEFYRRMRNKVMGFSYKLLRSQEEAKELTQEIFVKIWENRESIDPSRNFDALLFVMVRSTFLDDLKKKNRWNNYLQRSSKEEPYIDSTEHYMNLVECQDILSKALESMPPQAKRVYYMSREEGLSHKEISEELSISTNTVNNHIKRSITHIKQQFAQVSPDTALYSSILFLIVGFLAQ